MKLLLFVLLSGSVLLTTSCASEYNERLAKAREIKMKLDVLIKSADLTEEVAQLEVQDLYKAILFEAKVSGNEELFINELGFSDSDADLLAGIPE